MSYQLKCKAIALAVEAQAFKKQEQREVRLAKKWLERSKAGKVKAEKFVSNQPGIRNHRLTMVRKEARNALLAYGFVRGLSYAEMENFSWTQPNWDRIEKLAIRYSDLSEQEVKQSYAQWRDVALNGVQPKWFDTVVPGSIKNADFDEAWVNMQLSTRPVAKAELKPKTVPDAKVWDQKQYVPEVSTSLWSDIKNAFVL